MGKVVWSSTLLILVLSCCQSFDAIVEGGHESAPRVHDTKNDQNHKRDLPLELPYAFLASIKYKNFTVYQDMKNDIMRSVDTLLDSFQLLLMDVLNHLQDWMEVKLAQLKNPTTCYSGMANDAAIRYKRLVTMRDNTLRRDILCDTQTDGGGWIVIQRRTKGDVDFERVWVEYKYGFGTPPGDFWLGNEAIYDLTNKDRYELRIDYNNGTKDLFAVYSRFQLESERTNYTLQLGFHSGTLGEDSAEFGLTHHNGMQFSTFDRHNDDPSSGYCAELYGGGWWYKRCFKAYLNGRLGTNDSKAAWWSEGAISYNAYSTEMKIRRL